MKPLLEVLNLSVDFLKTKGIESPRLNAEELIAHCLGISRTQLYMEFDRPLIEKELECCRNLLSRRSQGEPLSYILGCVDFLNCVIHVNRSVLIPRLETELLAERIVNEIKSEPYVGKYLLDLCSGSGCLGISIKKELPDLNVILSDLSPEAMKVAKENCTSNGVEVECLIGDFFTPLKERRVDYLVCNPPYVTEEEYRELCPQVKDFEPKLALVGGRDGLDFYRRLNQELPQKLNSGAKVWLEMGHAQGESLMEIFFAPFWVEKKIIPDLSGKQRFFFLR